MSTVAGKKIIVFPSTQDFDFDLDLKVFERQEPINAYATQYSCYPCPNPNTAYPCPVPNTEHPCVTRACDETIGCQTSKKC